MSFALIRCLAVWAAVVTAAVPVSAVTVRTEASAAWWENIGRSSAVADWRDAMRYDGSASVSLFREWRAGFMTTGDVGVGFEHVPAFSKLDAFHGGLTATVRQKFGFGALAPALALDLGVRQRDAKLAGADGTTATAALRGSKRVTESWRAGVAAEWQQHAASRRTFDTRHHRVYATVAWDITSKLQVSHGNGRLWGEFTANASQAVWSRARSGALGSNVAAYYSTVPWATTDVLGPRWVTYRVRGHVSFWWLELSPALGRNTSLPLRYESLFSVNKAGVKYRQDAWSLQLLHRF